MQLENLRFVAHYAASTISSNDLHGRYTNLVKRLEAAVASPGSNQPPAIHNETQALLTAIRPEPPLTPDQRTAWLTLGIDRVLGPSAAARIEQSFTHHIGHPAAIAQELVTLDTETQLVLQLCSLVTKNVQRFEGVPPQRESPVLSIRCGHAVDARNLEDLEDRVSQWNLILKTLAEAAGVPPSSPPLVALERGSVIFGVTIDPETWTILKLLAEAVIPTLGAMKGLIELRTVLAKAKIPTEPVQTKIEEQTAQAEGQALAALAAARPGATPEQKAHHSAAIVKLTLFLRDGGEFHYLPGPSGTDADTQRVSDHLLRFYAERNQVLAAATEHERLPAEGSKDPSAEL